jgi:hypothetical protein
VYASYLQRTDTSKERLLRQLQDDAEVRAAVSSEGRRFTALMFTLVQELGGGRPLHRHMLV